MEIDRVREALQQAEADASVWANRASEATDRAGKIGAKVWNMSTYILQLGEQTAIMLREEYPGEVGAANNEANDALRTMEANISQTLAGSTSRHATDAIINARIAIEKGEAVASSVAASGSGMAELLEDKLLDLIIIMRRIARQQIYLPFLSEGEVSALQDLNDASPISTIETPAFTLEEVGQPVANTVAALDNYLDEL